jgi:hypothetical protein
MVIEEVLAGGADFVRPAGQSLAGIWQRGFLESEHFGPPENQ